MTDSEESDSLSNNVFAFPLQHSQTTIVAKGPNFSRKMTFNNSNMNSTTWSRNLVAQRHPASLYDRSMCYGRLTRPMSFKGPISECGSSNQSYFGAGMYSQSLYNGRCVSSVSVRTTDSKIPVDEIKQNLKTYFKDYNNDDMIEIRNFCNRILKGRLRKGIEKRRKRTLKRARHRNDDSSSGVHGSDSSNSDDNGPIKTLAYKENLKQPSLSEFGSRVTNKKSTNFSQPLQTVASLHQENINNTQNKIQRGPIMSQKTRFQNGFLLPSQRFTKAVAQSSILEKRNASDNNTILNSENNKLVTQNNIMSHNYDATEDSDEEIFSKRKRHTENLYKKKQQRSASSEDDVCYPDKKKSKLSSPQSKDNLNTAIQVTNTKTTHKGARKKGCYEFPKPVTKTSTTSIHKEKTDDFVFLKPGSPVKKIQTNEKILAMSCNVGETVKTSKGTVITSEVTSVSTTPKNKDAVPQDQDQSETQFLYSDLSMKPSFIKRKLFTQKLDCAENRNLSSDGNIVLNSSKDVYSKTHTEKNKTRKLVNNQSCLQRDVLNENNNILDLINKIVPFDQNNITNIKDRPPMNQDKNYQINIDDSDFDVSCISQHKNDDGISDTFTDEENSKLDNSETASNNNNNTKEIKVNQSDKIQPKNKKTMEKQVFNHKATHNILDKNKSKDNKTCNPKSFWDTDCESELDCAKNSTFPLNTTNNIQNKGSKQSRACNLKSFWDTDTESELDCGRIRHPNFALNTKNNVHHKGYIDSLGNNNNKKENATKKNPNNSKDKEISSSKNPSPVKSTKSAARLVTKTTKKNIREKGTAKNTVSEQLKSSRSAKASDFTSNNIDIKQTNHKKDSSKPKKEPVVENFKQFDTTSTRKENKKPKENKKQPNSKQHVQQTKVILEDCNLKHESTSRGETPVFNIFKNRIRIRSLRTPKKKTCCDNQTQVQQSKPKYLLRELSALNLSTLNFSPRSTGRSLRSSSADCSFSLRPKKNVSYKGYY